MLTSFYMARTKNQSQKELASGLSMIAAFGLLWVFTDWMFWLFPMVFAGFLPAIRGFVGLMSNRLPLSVKPKAPTQEQKNRGEKEILRLAKREGGKVTPALVALETSLSIEESEIELNKLVTGGYSSMEVTDQGKIEYVFHDFVNKIDKIE
jgi:hypothetical protein